IHRVCPSPCPRALYRRLLDSCGRSERHTNRKDITRWLYRYHLNIGPDCLSENNSYVLDSGQAYLIGTMTRFKETLMLPETRLLGIRFKPAAFTVFYDYPSLEKLTDTTVALDKSFAPDFDDTIKYAVQYLDHFFLKKLSKPVRSILPMI